MAGIRSALEVGLTGSYTIERELGRGGMASVLLARDLRHGRLVALKVLDPNLAASLGADRFTREIRVAARLQHPHILTVLDSGEVPGGVGEPPLLWYTMPFVEGETLQQRLDREGQLPVAEAVAIAREVADALGHAHEHGVVHRDIKPANLLMAGNHALVADFGIARALDAGGEKLTSTGLAIGTPAYMSPEQASGGGDVDARTDVYALGCVLYQMLAGEPPHTGPSAMAILARALTERPRPLGSLRTSVPPALERVVDTALAKAPADRYRSGAEMAAALTSLELAPVTPGAAALPPVTTVRPAYGRRAIVGVGAALLLAVVAALLLSPSPTRTSGDGHRNLVAVAPFDVISSDPELVVWDEGIVDVLARYFDGAGILGAVAPTRAIRAWRGRADPEAAARFGRELSARYVIFGQLVGSTDSVRLIASLYDLSDSTEVDSHAWRGEKGRVDRLVDSLATRFLDILGRKGDVGAVRSAPIGTSNPLALRAFLSGMRDLRRAAYAAAAEHFMRAIAEDTTFVLARYYAGYTSGWQLDRGKFDEMVRLSLEAGARNRGLTQRDSFLVLGDSIDRALTTSGAGPPQYALAERLPGIMADMLARYPDDPEVLYWVVEMSHHNNPVGRSHRWNLERFLRVIDLDPHFAPAYEHVVELSALLEPAERTREFIGAMLAIPGFAPIPPRGGALGLVHALLDPAVPVSARQAAMDTAPVPVLARTVQYLRLSVDTMVVAAARTWHRRAPSPVSSTWLLDILMYHGKLAEAEQLLLTLPITTRRLAAARELALHGALPAARFDSLFDQLPAGSIIQGLLRAVPVWVAFRDTASLRQIRTQVRVAMAATQPDLTLDPVLGAFHDLAGGDSSWFREGHRPPWPPGWWASSPFGALPADLSLALRPDDETWTLLQSRQDFGPYPSAVLWELYRARMAERRGERAIALDGYGVVARIWAGADAPLQPHVAEAKVALARLADGAEGGKR